MPQDNKPRLTLAESRMIETFSLNGLIFTQAELDAIRSAAYPGLEFGSNVFEIGRGRFFAPLSHNTMKELKAVSNKGESPSAVILRIIAVKKGLN